MVTNSPTHEARYRFESCPDYKCVVPLRKEWFPRDAAVIDDTEDFSSLNIALSSNGRTFGFGPKNGSSNLSGATWNEK